MEQLKSCVNSVDKSGLDSYTLSAVNQLQNHWSSNGTWSYSGDGWCIGPCGSWWWVFWILVALAVAGCCLLGVLWMFGGGYGYGYGGTYIKSKSKHKHYHNQGLSAVYVRPY
jgi:hypothetical protein